MLLVKHGLISQEECAEIIGHFHRAPDLRRTPNRVEKNGVRGALDRVRALALEEMKVYSACPDLMHETTIMTAMWDGDYHGLHADAERNVDGKWVPNHTPQRNCTAMVYLNTSGVDYTGGEINFPELAQEVAPAAGLMVGFFTSHAFAHEVRPVTGGTRYSISMWFTLEPEWQERWS